MAVHVGCAEHDATDQTVAAFRDALVGEPTQQEYDEASAAPAEAPTAPSLDDLIGSDGSEQATDAAVARHFPKLPILLMNGYADQRERVSGLEALICDVIAKPFALAEIKFAVASALAKGKRRP